MRKKQGEEKTKEENVHNYHEHPTITLKYFIFGQIVSHNWYQAEAIQIQINNKDQSYSLWTNINNNYVRSSTENIMYAHTHTHTHQCRDVGNKQKQNE